ALEAAYQAHLVARVYPEYFSKMQNLVASDIKDLSSVDMMLRKESLRDALRICVLAMDPLSLSNSSREILSMLDIPILFNISRKALQERELLFGAPCAYLNEPELKALIKFYNENKHFL